MGRPTDPNDELKRYEGAKQLRAPYESDWKQAAAFVLPRQYSAWMNDGPASMVSGQRVAKRFAYDNTGVNALPKFISLVNRLITPDGMRYVAVKASDPNLMKTYGVRKFFDDLSSKLDTMRKAARARCVQSHGELYASIGVYGPGPYRTSWRKRSPIDRSGGFMYKAMPLRDFFITVDDDGNHDGTYFRFWLNARTFKLKWPDTPAPKSVQVELDKIGGPSESAWFEFVHVVRLRDDYDASALNARRHPWMSFYIAVKDGEYVGDEEGFISMPYSMPRVSSEANDPYGYSPAMQALPALGGVNAMKKTILKSAHKAVDPVLLANDDGVLSGRVGLTPGHVNYGGINSQGQRMIQALETNGNWQVAENTLKDERDDINKAFLADIFQWFVDKPEMTATQTTQMIATMSGVLAPVMGRMQAEFLGPRTSREIDMLAEHGELGELPPELIEAKGEYELVYTSPLSKAIYADEVSGHMRLTDYLIELSQAKQDPSLLDWLNNDEAIPQIGEFMGSRTSWISDPATVAASREANQQQQQNSELIKQAPAAASIAKAAMDKNNVGGVAAALGAPQQ